MNANLKALCYRIIEKMLSKCELDNYISYKQFDNLPITFSLNNRDNLITDLLSYPKLKLIHYRNLHLSY